MKLEVTFTVQGTETVVIDVPDDTDLETCNIDDLVDDQLCAQKFEVVMQDYSYDEIVEVKEVEKIHFGECVSETPSISIERDW